MLYTTNTKTRQCTHCTPIITTCLPKTHYLLSSQILRDLRFSRLWLCRLWSIGLWRHEDLLDGYKRFVGPYSLHIQVELKLLRRRQYVPPKRWTARRHHSEDHNLLGLLWDYSTKFLYASPYTSRIHRTWIRNFLHPTCEVFFKGAHSVLKTP
jgi:hypothetical protein